jgi:hypothetical protein
MPRYTARELPELHVLWEWYHMPLQCSHGGAQASCIDYTDSLSCCACLRIVLKSLPVTGSVNRRALQSGRSMAKWQ